MRRRYEFVEAPPRDVSVVSGMRCRSRGSVCLCISQGRGAVVWRRLGVPQPLMSPPRFVVFDDLEYRNEPAGVPYSTSCSLPGLKSSCRTLMTGHSLRPCPSRAPLVFFTMFKPYVLTASWDPPECLCSSYQGFRICSIFLPCELNRPQVSHPPLSLPSQH
jgi:hypothetical protein